MADQGNNNNNNDLPAVSEATKQQQCDEDASVDSKVSGSTVGRVEGTSREPQSLPPAQQAVHAVTQAMLQRASEELEDLVTREALVQILGQAFDPVGWDSLATKFGRNSCAPGSYTYSHADPNIAFVKIQYVLAYLTQRHALDRADKGTEKARISIEGHEYGQLFRGHYDVVVVGNGFRENMIALLSAQEGNSVLHITFPKALEQLRNHPEASIFSTHDTGQLQDDELSSFTLSELSAILHGFVKPTIHLQSEAATARSAASKTVPGELSPLRKTYSCLGKFLPTAVMSMAARSSPNFEPQQQHGNDSTAGQELRGSAALSHAKQLPKALRNCNSSLSASQLGLRPEDVFNWSFRLVDQKGLGRRLRGGAPNRCSKVHVPHRDKSNTTCYSTASTQKYHISPNARLLPSAGNLMDTLRALGALKFLDLVPAGVDCMWLGEAEKSNAGSHSGVHQTARGMQPVPGTADATLQCEALNVDGKRRLRQLHKLAEAVAGNAPNRENDVPQLVMQVVARMATRQIPASCGQLAATASFEKFLDYVSMPCLVAVSSEALVRFFCAPVVFPL